MRKAYWVLVAMVAMAAGDGAAAPPALRGGEGIFAPADEAVRARWTAFAKSDKSKGPRKAELAKAESPVLQAYHVSGAPLRIIGELRMPESLDEANRMENELSGWRARGYNSVLVVWYDDDLAEVRRGAELMGTLRRDGWILFLANGTPDPVAVLRHCNPERLDLGATPYKDPVAIAGRLALLATNADFFIPMWRGSSLVHLATTNACDRVLRRETEALAREYAAPIVSAVLDANPDCRICGIVETIKLPALRCEGGFLTYLPEEADAVIATGFTCGLGDNTWLPEDLTALVAACAGRTLPVICAPVADEPYWQAYFDSHGHRGSGEALSAPEPELRSSNDGRKLTAAQRRQVETNNEVCAAFKGLCAKATGKRGMAWAHSENAAWAQQALADIRTNRGIGWLGLSDVASVHPVRVGSYLLAHWTPEGEPVSWQELNMPALKRRWSREQLLDIDRKAERYVDYVLSRGVWGALRVVGDCSGDRMGNSDVIGRHWYPWPAR